MHLRACHIQKDQASAEPHAKRGGGGMLKQDEAKAIILEKMRELGLNVDAEGVQSKVIAELFGAFMEYLLLKAEIDTPAGKGKIS